VENSPTPDCADRRPGIPTWRFYLYALWLIGGALVFTLVLVLLAPVASSVRDLSSAPDMTLDSGRSAKDGAPSDERR
jgi:hypothetical protein